MAKLMSSNLVVLSIVGFMSLLYGTNKVVVGQCQADLESLITQCAVFVEKGTPKADPSPACCDAIKATDVSCVCQNLPPEVLKIIDKQKVTFVAQFCGKPIPPGTQCGSASQP